MKSEANVHTIVNVSLDTNSRQMALTIDGVLTPFTDLSLHKFIDFDGEESIAFSYTIESVGDGGMQERRQFFLPDPSDAVLAKVDKNGLASKVVQNDEKAKADSSDFIRDRLKLARIPRKT